MILKVYETYSWLNVLFAVCIIATIISGVVFVKKDVLAGEESKYAFSIFYMCSILIVVFGTVKLSTPYYFLVKTPDEQNLIKLSQHFCYEHINENIYLISPDNILDKLKLLLNAKLYDVTFYYVTSS